MLSVKHLKFNYPGQMNPAVNDISFEIKKGEIFGFLGPSGAGKSTSQKLLTGILKKYEGNIKYDNVELKKLGNDFYENVGISFEFPNLYLKLTAIENLDFIRKFYNNQGMDNESLLKMVGLSDHGHLKVSKFSKGMKMRLNFIRALVHDPDILFLDEPTSGLDPVNGQMIKSIILDLKAQGKTIFLTTHDMYVADALCDRVAFMVDGELACIDQPENLKSTYGDDQIKVETDGGHVHTFEKEKLYYNEAFMEILKEDNLKRIHSQEATLEQVFIKVTGRRLD